MIEAKQERELEQANGIAEEIGRKRDAKKFSLGYLRESTDSSTTESEMCELMAQESGPYLTLCFTPGFTI
jgi:hypothetical protein